MTVKGRPTKYNEELEAQAHEYLTDYKTKYGDEIPSVVGLCNILNLSRSTAYKWAEEDDKDFSYILDRINTTQQQVLLNNGLNGVFNAQIAKLVLGKHGYSEKKEVEASVTMTHEEWMSQLD